MYQPYPSSGQPTEPRRPPARGPARTAVKLMYAGAAISIVPLIIALASIGDTKGRPRRTAVSPRSRSSRERLPRQW